MAIQPDPMDIQPVPICLGFTKPELSGLGLGLYLEPELVSGWVWFLVIPPRTRPENLKPVLNPIRTRTRFETHVYIYILILIYVYYFTYIYFRCNNPNYKSLTAFV